MQHPSNWENCRSILCIRPDNLGDVLMTTPAIRAVKETFPRCRITLLTSSAGAVVAPFLPEIDDTITFDVPWVRTRDARSVDELVETVKNHRFDGAVLFNVQSQNPLPAAMICYLAGIPRVLGYCRENPYHLLTDWVPDPEVLYATRHEVERQLDLVTHIGSHTRNRRLSLRVPREARRQALEQLTEAGVDLSEPWLLLHPGVSEAKRRYPAESYVQAGRQLINELGYQAVLTGSASEKSYAEQIRQALGNRAFNLAGAFPMEQFAGLVAEAPVLISNNTGPVHIAAAVQTPVVVLYAMTNPQHTPWLVENRVLYFEVPPALRSKNALLQTFPGPAEPKASPAQIVQAVREISCLAKLKKPSPENG